MISNKTNIKNIILIFAPLITSMIVQFFVSLVDVIILLLKNMLNNMAVSGNESATLSLKDAYSSSGNVAFVTMAQYTLYIIVFGLWYYMCFTAPEQKNNTSDKMTGKPHISDSIRCGFSSIKPGYLIPCLIVAGYTSQLSTDAVLTLIRNHAPELFTNYDRLLESMTGSYASPMMLISVFLLAPIGEEILFRGLILSYSKAAFAPVLSSTLNGLLFGVYHGNVIQGIYAFVFGILLSCIALHFDSIVPGIILHLTINCSIIFIFDFFFKTDLLCFVTLGISLIILIAMLIIIFKKSHVTKNIIDKI